MPHPEIDPKYQREVRPFEDLNAACPIKMSEWAVSQALGACGYIPPILHVGVDPNTGGMPGEAFLISRDLRITVILDEDLHPDEWYVKLGDKRVGSRSCQ